MHVLKCFADWQICLWSEVMRSLFLHEAFAVKTVLLSLLHFYGKIKKFAGVWKRNLALWPGMAANSVTSCHSRYQESKFGFAGLNLTVCWSWGVWELSESTDSTGLVNAMCSLWGQGGGLYYHPPYCGGIKCKKIKIVQEVVSHPRRRSCTNHQRPGTGLPPIGHSCVQ